MQMQTSNAPINVLPHYPSPWAEVGIWWGFITSNPHPSPHLTPGVDVLKNQPATKL